MNTNSADVSNALAALLSELADGASSDACYVLNRGAAGLVQSLEKLSATAASQPAPTGSTIGAHVDHLSGNRRAGRCRLGRSGCRQFFQRLEQTCVTAIQHVTGITRSTVGELRQESGEGVAHIGTICIHGQTLPTLNQTWNSEFEHVTTH